MTVDQNAIIMALIEYNGDKAKAAESIGISQPTIYKYLKDPKFRRRYRRQARRTFEAAKLRACNYMFSLVGELIHRVKHGSDYASMRAAQLLFEISKGTQEHEAVIDEIEKLKAEIAELNAPKSG